MPVACCSKQCLSWIFSTHFSFDVIRVSALGTTACRVENAIVYMYIHAACFFHGSDFDKAAHVAVTAVDTCVLQA